MKMRENPLLGWLPAEEMSEREVIAELRWVRDTIASGGCADWSTFQLKMRLNECLQELARNTATGRCRALSEVRQS